MPARPMAALSYALLVTLAAAHEHVIGDIPDNAVISDAPIDRKLWLHIIVMMTAFGVLYPLGMVFGLTRSRWHVPTQVFATGLAAVGVLLGHTKRTGRQFRTNIHSRFAPWFVIFIIAQVALGVYLRMHLQRGMMKHVHRLLVPIHGWMGTIFPILSWIQMGFGGLVALGFCRNSTGDHLGQCLAHGIMGSAFIGYGVVMIVMLNAYDWLARLNVAQETIDSAVIMAWGLVNTFTEHRWGSPWSHKDLQHTSMGIVWFCAGIAGVYLGSKDGRPRRNVIPALVIAATGWAMANHKQALLISTQMHSNFGYVLTAAGLTRAVEVAVILRDSARDHKRHPRAFQYIPPFLLIASGLLFMGSNEEQIAMINDAMIDHVSYTLLLSSIAFLIFFWANFLVGVYNSSGVNGVDEKQQDIEHGRLPRDLPPVTRNGQYSRPAEQAGQDRRYDQDEFELGLMSDEEEGSRPEPKSQEPASARQKPLVARSNGGHHD